MPPGPTYHERWSLPIGPLQRALDREFPPFPKNQTLGEVSRADTMGASLERAYRRALEVGHVSLHVADRICCIVLGIHPCLLWPEQYWTVKIREPAPGHFRPATPVP